MLPEKKAGQLLTERHQTIGLAESCSGGLLANRLTNIPGSSSFFYGGVVAYSNETKRRVLGIPLPLIKKHGAVSAIVAQMMAKNARRLHQTDLGIGITGIAGPSGGTKQKPIGLVFIALAQKGRTVTRRFVFKGTRLQVKKQATDRALKLLLTLLLQRPHGKRDPLIHRH